MCERWKRAWKRVTHNLIRFIDVFFNYGLKPEAIKAAVRADKVRGL